MKNIISKILVSIVSFLFFSLFVWYKFLRERATKNIPFNLELYSFLLTLMTCVFLAYSLHLWLYPNPSKFSFNLLESLKYLNKNRNRFLFFKTNLQEFLFQSLDHLLLRINDLNSLIVLLRYIILGVFLVDVFFYNQFFYSYYTVFLLIPVYFLKYLIFSYHELLEQKINLVSKKYEIFWGGITGIIVNPSDYVVAQTKHTMKNNEKFPSDIWLTSDYISELVDYLGLKRGQKLNTKPYEILGENILEQCLKIQKLLYLDFLFKQQHKILFLLIIIIYLFTWLYILLLSIYYLPEYKVLAIIESLSCFNNYFQEFIMSTFI